MNNQYNIWNKWDPLKTVMLGDTYGPEFFRDIKNDKIRSALTQIAEETQEDLEGYSKVLKDFGCEVLRPKLDPNDSIMNYINNETGETKMVPRAPLQPRDAQIVLGNKLAYTFFDHPAIIKKLKEYNDDFIDYHQYDDFYINDNYYLSKNEYNKLKNRYNQKNDWPSYNQYLLHRDDKYYFSKEVFDRIYPYYDLQAPSITICGKDLYFDKQLEIGQSPSAKKLIENQYIQDNFKVNRLTIGGHNDGCFALLKEGAILSLYDIQRYDKTFPGWEICYLKDRSWYKLSPFLKIKEKNYGSFWVPGQEDNDEFTHFVMSWLNDWVGYVEESVFDVNVLVLDEHHVCVSQMNNPLINIFLKRHKMEPIYVPWRHRYFWDGGLHCITLDLYREGEQQDYFPDRTECVVCEGYI